MHRVGLLLFSIFYYLLIPINWIEFGKNVKHLLIAFSLIGIASIFHLSNSLLEKNVLSYSPTSFYAKNSLDTALSTYQMGDIFLAQLMHADLSMNDSPTAFESLETAGLEIFPEKKLLLQLKKVEEMLTLYPTSRDLWLKKASLAKSLNDTSLYAKSLETLVYLDPNNEMVRAVTSN